MIWIALGIGVGIFCVTFLIWKFIAKRKSLDEFTWKESPQSLIGLFLLVFPLEFRRFLALLIVLFIGAIAAIGAFQIFTQRQRDIELNAKERVKEEKLKYWNKENDASLKVGLLRLWKKYGEVPKEVWSEYQNESDIDVLIEMAAHPWVPEEILIYSLRHGNSRLRIAAMLNTSNKDIVINRLSNDSEDFLRRAVAESPFISKELLKKMRKDDKYSVRIAVAKNKNTEPTDLDDMKDDDEWRVREAIAKNPKVLKGTLEYLSSDDVWQVRKAVAMAPKTPDEYIKNLIQDGSEFVSYAAKNRSITLKKSFSITLETEKKKIFIHLKL